MPHDNEWNDGPRKPNPNQGEWEQPAAPPAPLFLGEKERNLVKQVNDELLERVIGQQIAYYPISRAKSNYHPLYGEAIEKNFLSPVRVYALIEWPDATTVYADNIGLDKEWHLTIHFHRRRLCEDQDTFVREGDFVLYGETLYEIVKTSLPRMLFGQIEHAFEITAVCLMAREGLFDAQ